jgi:hypothetical protein
LGFNNSDFQLFALVPLTSEQAINDALQHNPEIGIRLNDSSLTLRNVEEMLLCKEKSQTMLEKNKKALL